MYVCLISWNWNYKQLSAAMCSLGFEPGSLGRAASVLNRWVICPAPGFIFIFDRSHVDPPASMPTCWNTHALPCPLCCTEGEIHGFPNVLSINRAQPFPASLHFFSPPLFSLQIPFFTKPNLRNFKLCYLLWFLR